MPSRFAYTLRKPKETDERAIARLALDRARALGLELERDVRTRGLHLPWAGHPKFDPVRDARAARVDGHLAGYVWVRVGEHPDLSGRRAAFLEGWVDSNYRRTGVGTQLVDWACDAARAQGFDTIRTVIGSDVEAQQLFRQHGFTFFKTSLRIQNSAPEKTSEASWPDGVTLRNDFTGEELVDTYWAFDLAAFGNEPGFRPSAREDFLDVPAGMDPSLITFAFDREGKPAGFIAAALVADVGVIDDLGVLRPHRRRGLGRALLRHALRELSARGARKVSLEVGAENERALALYRSEGFETSLEHRGYLRAL